MLLKVLQRKFEGVNKYISHGSRGLVGVKLKSASGRQVKHYTKIDDGVTESTMPAF